LGNVEVICPLFFFLQNKNCSNEKDCPGRNPYHLRKEEVFDTFKKKNSFLDLAAIEYMLSKIHLLLS